MFDSFFRRLHRTQHFEISLFANCFRNQFQTQIQVWLGPDSDAADVAPATAQYWAIISESRASWIPCRTALYNWVRRRPARARLRRLVNSARPGQSRVTVTAWAGPAIVRWAVREERGQIYCAPEVLQITNRYNENDGVSKRVHELAFGIVICFGHGHHDNCSRPGAEHSTDISKSWYKAAVLCAGMCSNFTENTPEVRDVLSKLAMA